MALTDRQGAVVLVREWLKKKGKAPHDLTRHEMADILGYSRPVSEIKRSAVLLHVNMLIDPLIVEMDEAYLKIKGMKK